MFGSIYGPYPEVLVRSLHEMDGRYSKSFTRLSGLHAGLARLYITLFGIPEIGFQIRGMHFQNILRGMGGIRPSRVLDIGTGIGCYAFFLAKRYPGARVTGWDIDRSKLTVAKALAKNHRLPNAAYEYSDILARPGTRGTYDFIIIIDVLEHISDYRKALRHISVLLKPGGVLYIHVPKPEQVRYFRETASWKHEDHAREGFDPKELTRELEKLGLSVETVRHTFGPIGSLAWEINHLMLTRSQILAAITYPFLYALSRIDGIIPNTRGLCTAYVIRKHAP